MEPISFDESNTVLSKPVNMTADQCDPLSVFTGTTPDGHPVIVSCWRLTQAEIDDLVCGRRLWVWIYNNSMPPIKLTAIKPQFKTEE